MTNPCPVCGTPLSNEHVQSDRYFFECPRCGPFSFTYEAKIELETWMHKYEDVPARLSYAIRKMTNPKQWALINSHQLVDILDQTRLPSPQEQLENLVMWIGNQQKRPGAYARPTISLISEIGATDLPDLSFIIKHAMNDAGVIAANIAGIEVGVTNSWIQLTFKGWEFYEALKRGHGASKVAFMAMKFNESDLDAVVENYFKPAVAATGFELRRINDGQAAGLIDDRLRVAIRQARFIVADLTHHNNGAYWEAGYAEGLGKPVIYTCRRDIFDDKKQGTHFDTNHHLTVVWEPGKPEEAAQRLKDTIRATLPAEAQQEK